MKDTVGQLKQPNRRPRSGKLKSVTFTGCWTCRSRKIKCDERQRNGCGVCEKAGLDCAGYGVNLCWVTGQKKPDQGLRRRRITPEQSSSPILSDDEITGILSTLDRMSSPSNTVTLGPFAIFDAQATGQTGGCYSQQLDNPPYLDGNKGSQEDQLSEDDTTKNADADISDIGLQSPQGDYTVGTDIEQSYTSLIQGLEIFGEDGLRAAQLKSSPYGSEALEFGLSPSWDPWPYPNDGISSSLTLQSPTSPHLGLSMPLFQDCETSTLMYHYMDNVADLLQPVLHPSNPWRTTYFPFALEGCPELFLFQNSSPSSDASIALFHSLLSSAAFHLRNVTGDAKRFHKLGLQHRAKSLQALNTALIRPTDSQLYTVHLTAMLSLVTIDTMTGEDADFPIHLKACRQLRKPHSSILNDSGRQVNTICHFLTLLSRTTTLKLDPESQPADQASFFDQILQFHSEERSIEHIYGITPKLGNLLEKACKIAEYLTFYRGDHIPDFLLSASEELKYELCAWDIDSEPFYSIGPEQGTMLEIARCQARAFHSAVLIFYYRTIESSNLVNLEEEVRFIWENLTDAENLKDDCMGGERRAAPMSWPAFIAACEATDRRPWAEWWMRVQGYGMGNFTKQWRVIRELWNVMDTDTNITSWIDALKQSGELILPI